MIFKIRFYFSVFLLFLLFGCEVQFEKNTRILVTGKTVDENNLPVEDVSVKVFTRDSQYLMGSGLSSANGNFEVISFYDQDDDFIIEIEFDNTFSTYSYRMNTEGFTPENFTIDLGQVPINRLANFNLNITRVSPPDTELQFSLLYIAPECNFLAVDGSIDLGQSQCFESFSLSRLLNNNNPDISRNINTLLGSEVVFTYSANGNPSISETFIINQTDYEFNFSY